MSGSWKLALLTLVVAAMPVAVSSQPIERPPELAERDDILPIESADAAMNAAIAEARSTSQDFIAAFRSGRFEADTFVFKYPLGGFEHIWVELDRVDGVMLTGRIANVPAQPEWHEGQQLRVALSEISDWGYRDTRGRMIGHRTTRVLLPIMDAAMRDAIVANFGW